MCQDKKTNETALLYLIKFICFLLITTCIQAQSNFDQTLHLIANRMNGGKIPNTMISPNGNWIVYQKFINKTDSSPYISEWWLQRLNKQGKSVENPVLLPKNVWPMAWAPDGRLTVNNGISDTIKQSSGLYFYDPNSGEQHVIPMRCADSLSKKIGGNFLWSPHGNYIAFTIGQPGGLFYDFMPQEIGPINGVPVEPVTERAFNKISLFVLEVATGGVKQITTDSMSLSNAYNLFSTNEFDWSPDEKQLVMSVVDKNDPDGFGDLRTNLVLADVKSGKIEPLVIQQGVTDAGPKW